MAVKHITRGDGILYAWGTPVGYLSGGVTAALDVQTEKFQAGSPKRTIVQVPVGANFTLKAGLAELSPGNFGRAMGQQASTAIVSGTVSVSTPANKIFVLDPSTGEEVIMVGPGMGLAETFTSLVVKDSTGTTTLSGTTDYSFDATTGKLTRLTTGTITSLDEVQIFSYSYAKIAGNKVDVGFEQALMDIPLCFVHTNPKTKKRTFVVMHKAQSDGKFSLAFADEWLKTDVTWEALEDTTRTDDSLGYVIIED